MYLWKESTKQDEPAQKVATGSLLGQIDVLFLYKILIYVKTTFISVTTISTKEPELSTDLNIAPQRDSIKTSGIPGTHHSGLLPIILLSTACLLVSSTNSLRL